MEDHHEDPYHFLMKISQPLYYIGVDPEAGFKKKQYLQGQHSYDKNRSSSRSLMDASFILFTGADKDKFIAIFDGYHALFSLDIINSIEDDNEPKEE